MARAADPNMENNTQVKDDIGNDIIKAQIESLNKEIDLFKTNKKNIEEGKERFMSQWKRDDELWTFKKTGFRKLEPTYEFEKSERYWELIAGVIEDQYLQDKVKAASTLDGIDAQLKTMQEQIDSAQQKLNELTSGDQNGG